MTDALTPVPDIALGPHSSSLRFWSQGFKVSWVGELDLFLLLPQPFQGPWETALENKWDFSLFLPSPLPLPDLSNSSPSEHQVAGRSRSSWLRQFLGDLGRDAVGTCLPHTKVTGPSSTSFFLLVTMSFCQKLGYVVWKSRYLKFGLCWRPGL